MKMIIRKNNNCVKLYITFLVVLGVSLLSGIYWLLYGSGNEKYIVYTKSGENIEATLIVDETSEGAE